MKIKNYLKTAVAICLLVVSFSLIPISSTHAITNPICDKDDISESVKKMYDCPGVGKDKELQSVVTEILKAIIAAAGIVAVIFIIIGGINYMTSAGDAQKVEKGKKTIIYAAIGLVICALAFAIVNWVILGALGQGDDANTQDQNQTPTTGSYQLPIA